MINLSSGNWMNLYDKTGYCEIKTLNDVKGYDKIETVGRKY